jgi:hypothetical protein
MVWLTFPLVLPQASTALQVRVSEKVPAQTLPAVVSLTTCTVAPPQVSDAVGGVNTGVAGHEMVAFAPGEPIVGGVVSTTVMVWLTLPLVLPQASTALHVRVSE